MKEDDPDEDLEAFKRRKQKQSDQYKRLSKLPLDDLPNDLENKAFKPDFKYSKKTAFLVQRFGFPMTYTQKVLNENMNNFCSTVYYLVQKDQGKIA